MSRRSELRPFRRRLPVGDLRGHFSIAASALDELEGLLPTYRGIDGSHEGIAFLCGFELPTTTVLMTAIAPDADHSRGHVRCSETDMMAVSAVARSLGLGVLAQVHSHPSSLAWHSEGDDDMVLMPFEGMLSIVVPDYARFGLRPIDSLGVHQFQDRRWTLMTRESVKAGVTVIPAGVDLR